MYEIIDETLKIAGCGISDLTFEQTSSFLSQWEDGATLGSLTLFINTETGYLVLNRDSDIIKTSKTSLKRDNHNQGQNLINSKTLYHKFNDRS